mmetsp:Transcript_81183/g.263110  ORF Transcript_81183/g.263110 Transcript_81183/m.263110 type:complete len:218 (+) Transcript_81183:52-705(+)
MGSDPFQLRPSLACRPPAVPAEAHSRSVHRQRAEGRIGRSDSVPVLGSGKSTLSVQEPIGDHGLIYPGLHDLHRRAVQKAGPGSKAAVRLPPVGVAPLAQGSSWFWPSGGQIPADVESAVTINSTALAPTVASAASAPALGAASKVSGVPPALSAIASAASPVLPRSAPPSALGDAPPLPGGSPSRRPTAGPSAASAGTARSRRGAAASGTRSALAG